MRFGRLWVVSLMAAGCAAKSVESTQEQGGAAGLGGAAQQAGSSGHGGAAGEPSSSAELDCSGGSNGATTPMFCQAARSCSAAVNVVDLPSTDFTIVLPPAAAQDADACDGAAVPCLGGEGTPGSRAGYVVQLAIEWLPGVVVRIETDDQRIIDLTSGNALCVVYSSCFFSGNRADIQSLNRALILAKPDAPGGSVRIYSDVTMGCPPL